LGHPPCIVLGDSIGKTIKHEWRNIHWFRVGEHEREKVANLMAAMLSVLEPDDRPEPSETPATGESGYQQQEWTFE